MTQIDHHSDRLSRGAAAWAVWLVYSAVLAFAVARHAMWFDELQAWMIARQSGGIGELYRNLRLEGHPALWYLVLMPLARAGLSPLAMQAVHAVLAMAAAALVIWRAPFSLVTSAMVIAGYFMFYEYGMLARSYILGVLLVFLFCALWPSRRTHPVLLALVLALMANVHAQFAILALAASGAVLADRLWPGTASVGVPRIIWRWDIPCALIVGLGLAAAMVFGQPDAAAEASGWQFDLDPARAARITGLFGTLLFGAPGIAFGALAGVVILAGFLGLVRVPPAAAFLLLSVLGLVALFYLKYPGFVRHYGVVLVALVAAHWLGRIDRPDDPRPDLLGRTGRFALTGLLAVQLLGTVLALRSDLTQPLSDARDTAGYIRSQGWDRDPLIGTADQLLIPVAAYLGLERTFALQGTRWISFAPLDHSWFRPLDIDAALAAPETPRGTATLVSALAIAPDILARHGFVEAARFMAGRLSSENYIIYRRP